ncbi:MAG: hypothetical protein QMD80_00460 [archaeon]|nr:hypothetical protein [archaeon]
MGNPDMADFKEELNEEGLSDEEISKCIEIIKDIGGVSSSVKIHPQQI